MKIILIIFVALVIAALAAIGISLFLKANYLTRQVGTSSQMLIKMKAEVARVEAEREKLAKENDKLQTDAVSYIGINSELQKEKEDVVALLDEARLELEAKEEELKKLNQKFREADRQLAKTKVLENGKLNDEKANLTEKIKALEATLRKERGLYHYNLAVAYTEARLYDEAVDEYSSSLEVAPDNPEAHYNLGVLYENFKGDPMMAVEHYRRYLELRPNAGDKEEVEALIGRLEG